MISFSMEVTDENFVYPSLSFFVNYFIAFFESNTITRELSYP